MRATTMLGRLLKINYARVTNCEFTDKALIVDVEPTMRIARCSGCGCRARKLNDSRVRTWRHLDLAGMELYLRYRLRRVDCVRCGVIVELVPWAETGSAFTRSFEEMTAYLAQHAAKTVIVEVMRSRLKATSSRRARSERKKPACSARSRASDVESSPTPPPSLYSLLISPRLSGDIPAFARNRATVPASSGERCRPIASGSGA